MPETEQQSSPWLIMATVMLGTLLIGLDRTVTNIGTPKIIEEFGITVSTAGWIANAYTISNAVFVPVFGKLGDMLGNRFIYLISFIWFTIISVFVGAAWNVESLIFFRFLQGLVGAAVFPTALSIIARTFHDPQKRAQMMGIWSASFAISFILGPLIGGPLVDHFSWRMLFYMNLPVGILGIFMTLMFLPKESPESFGIFDYKGATALAISLISLTLVLEKGQEWGWLSVESILSYLLFVVFSVWFYFIERDHPNPLIDFKFFRNKIFSSSLAISFISFGGMMGSMFLLPIFAQTFLGYTATESGFLFIPMALMFALISPLGAKIATIIEPRWSISGGMLLASYGMYLFTGLDSKSVGSDLTIPLMIFATGVSLGMAPLTNAATSSVPRNEVGIASGILNLSRSIAGAIAIAVFSTVLNDTVKNNVLAIGQNTVINEFSPYLQHTVPALIILKAEILSFGHIFFLASVLMVIGALLATTFKQSSKDLMHTKMEPEAAAIG